MKSTALKEIYKNSLFSSFLDKASVFAENSFLFKKRDYFKKGKYEYPEILSGSRLLSPIQGLIQRLRPKEYHSIFKLLSLALFFLVFLFTPLKSWLKDAYTLGDIYTFIVPIFLIVIAASLFLRGKGKKEVLARFTTVDLGISFLVFSLFLSALAGFLVYGQTKNLLYEGFIWLSYFAIFYIGRLIFNTKKALTIFLIFNLSLVFALSLIGIGQYFFGVATPQWIEGYETIRTRAFSTLDNPIILSGYINIFFFIALGVFFGLKKIKYKFLMAPLFLVTLVVLVLTFSRGGWIGLAVGLLFFFFVYRPKYLLSVVPISIISLLMVPQEYFYRFLAMFDSRYGDISAVSGRTWTLNNVFHILPQHLLFGVGPGMYGGEVAFKTNPSIVYMEGIQGGAVPMQNTDNQFLQVLVQQGLVGIFAFLFFVGAIFYTGIVIYQKLDDRFLKMLALGITTSAVAFFVQGVFADVLQFPQMSLVMFGFLGILISLPKIQKIIET
jgi:O-antigen ligase